MILHVPDANLIQKMAPSGTSCLAVTDSTCLPIKGTALREDAIDLTAVFYTY